MVFDISWSSPLTTWIDDQGAVGQNSAPHLQNVRSHSQSRAACGTSRIIRRGQQPVTTWRSELIPWHARRRCPRRLLQSQVQDWGDNLQSQVQDWGDDLMKLETRAQLR